MRFDVLERLSEIGVPVHVVANRDDMLVPHVCSGLIAAGIPGAGMTMFDRGGHAGNVTDVTRFNAAMLAGLRMGTAAKK